MRSWFLDFTSASLLYAAIASYSKGDFPSARVKLDRFFESGKYTRDLRVNEILPKSGSTIRLMARIQSDDGSHHFLKISRPTDEYRFFRYGEMITESLQPYGVEIVCPSRAFRTLNLLGLIFPYHSEMRSPAREIDFPAVAAALARLNESGKQLRGKLRGSIQQRRSGNLLNVVRRNILSFEFIANERQVIMRTLHAMARYREKQSSVEKVFCHGDISLNNFFQYDGKTFLIDFANFFFFDPGFDLANIYGGSEERLRLVCAAYAAAFDGEISPQSIRLAAVYGNFFFCLRRAAKGRGSMKFRASLERLEQEL